MLRSSCAFSRRVACALAWSLHSDGSAAAAFSSSRRLSALSQSKMPPQQLQRLLDGGDALSDLGTHACSLAATLSRE
jgi:hypothetical protein